MVDVQYFTHNGHRLAYEDYGEGDRVVVLMHGLLLDAHLNRGLATALAAQGNRVLLLDLLGHGQSDRPRHASAHRMDRYARQCIALLDELDVESAIIGGVSLGANVSLHVAVQAPERVRGLFLEMPVLEWAAPAAALLFVPLLLGVHYGSRVVRLVSRLLRRVPRTGIGPVDSFLNAGSSDPEEIAAILHGLIVGPIAPEIEQRQRIAAPTLIIGHGKDLIHPFSDAANLAEQLPDARLVQAYSIAELRLSPTRLMGEITGFVNDVFQVEAPVTPLRSDA